MLWHYTVMRNLHRILADNELRPLQIAGKKHIKPVVWFTTHPDWEAINNPFMANPEVNNPFAPHQEARRGRLTKDQTIVLHGGLARIGVADDVAGLTWKDYKEQSGILPKEAKLIYDEAVSLNVRPGEWLATFDIVPREKWLAIEIWNDIAWVSKAP